MKHSKWIGIFSIVLLAVVSFQPWVYIASKDLVVTGMRASGTNFGRPALLSLVISGIAAIFLMPTVMAKRANLFFCAFNLAWSVRNYIILSSCRAGECPEKQIGLYLLILASGLMVLAALFPDLKLDQNEESQ